MDLTLTDAMAEMAGAMTAVNASRRQASGVATWAGYIDAAVTAARGAGEYGTPTADVPGSRVHAGWMAAARAIIAVLDGQAGDAGMRAGQAREQARQASDEARQASAAYDEAAGDGRDDDAAVAADQAAAALRAARRAEDAADACDAWQAAAADAASYGRALAAREDRIAMQVGAALAAAGGGRWIANDKQFLTDRGA